MKVAGDEIRVRRIPEKTWQKQAQEFGQDTLDMLTERIRENPAQSMLVAAGIGLLLGFVLIGRR